MEDDTVVEEQEVQEEQAEEEVEAVASSEPDPETLATPVDVGADAIIRGFIPEGEELTEAEAARLERQSGEFASIVAGFIPGPGEEAQPAPQSRAEREAARTARQVEATEAVEASVGGEVIALYDQGRTRLPQLNVGEAAEFIQEFSEHEQEILLLAEKDGKDRSTIYQDVGREPDEEFREKVFD